MDSSCETLQIPYKDRQSFAAIRSAYCKKMRIHSKCKQIRVQLNLAYLDLCRTAFKTTVSKDQQEIITAIVTGDYKRVQKLLRNKNELINFRTKGDGYPIIYHAVRSGHYDIVKLILEMGCKRDFSKDKSTPMHCAAYYGHYSLIPLLLQFGIPIDIKNSCDSLPIDEACSDQIKQLLKNASKNVIMDLSNKIIEDKLCDTMINIERENKIIVKKFILNNYLEFYQKECYNNFQDAFHGTDYRNLYSIAKYGLRPPGDKVSGKQISIVDGHIPVTSTVHNIKNWAKAVFLSPSIFYATHPVYSKQLITNESNPNNGEQQKRIWMPVLQVKVKKGTFTKHDHSLGMYNLIQGEPETLQFRVEMKNDNRKNLIYRNQDYRDVVIVAIMFIDKNYLDTRDDYRQATDLIIDSREERQMRKTRNMHC